MKSDQAISDRWVEIKPSNVNLALTLAAPLCAASAALIVDMPDWVRAVLLALLVMATVADVYLVRHLSAGAVSAFYVFEIDEPDGQVGALAVPKLLEVAAARQGAARPPKQPLGIRLRYRHPAKRGGIAEAEGVLGERAYVSTYFTSISYRLPGDPAWRRWFPRVVSLWADGVDREAFRQVRVQLKWL